MSAALRLAAMTLACLAASGCFLHKTRAVVPRVAQTPVPIEKAPEPETEPVIAQVPLSPAPLPAVVVPEKKPKKPRKKTPVPETPVAATPVQVASAAPPPDPGTVIGALTVGGDEAPEKKRQASGMLADVEKRLSGVGASVLDRQKEGITRVRYFAHEAKSALDAGDVDGAVTLVTKAKVLLDDLLK